MAIFIVACLVRAFFAVATPIDAWRTSLVDEGEYLVLAENLRFHGTFSYGAPHRWGAAAELSARGPYVPSLWRPPLYPMVVAALWWGAGPPIAALRGLQVLLGGATAALAFLMARRLVSAERNPGGRAVALVAGFAVALAPLSSVLTAAVMTETLFTFLVTAGAWAWGSGRGLLAGLLFGAACLTRAILVPFIAGVVLLGVVLRWNRRLHLTIAAAAGLTVLPWTARNLIVLHQPVVVATSGWGANLLAGTVDAPVGIGNIWLAIGADRDFAQIVATSPDETAAERRMNSAARDRILADPLGWLAIRAGQYPRLFTSSGSYLSAYVPVDKGLVRPIYMLGSAIFLVAALCGAWLSRRQLAETYFLLLFPLYVCGTHFFALVEERYSVTIVPMLAVFAAVAAIQLTGKGVFTGGSERSALP